MKTKTLEEWIAQYEKKTGVKYEQPDRRLIRLFFPDRGFAEIGMIKEMVIVYQLCGDVRFWKQVAESMAKMHGISVLGTWCIRPILPYIRFFGVEIKQIEDIGGGYKRYHGKFKDTGKDALFTPNFKLSNGNIGYIVTWHI